MVEYRQKQCKIFSANRVSMLWLVARFEADGLGVNSLTKVGQERASAEKGSVFHLLQEEARDVGQVRLCRQLRWWMLVQGEQLPIP